MCLYFSFIRISHTDCKIWKYPRLDGPDEYSEIPNTVKLNHLHDGQEFIVDGATIKVVYTPGHTTDHVVVSLKEDNSLFSGDCILGEGTAVFEDLYEYMRSLKLILDAKPSVIYPAHGNIIEDPLPKIQYYIDHRNKREAQILVVLKTNSDKRYGDMDLVKIIYKETPEQLWPAAAINLNHHLAKLEKDGLVEKLIEEDSNVVWQLKKSKL